MLLVLECVRSGIQSDFMQRYSTGSQSFCTRRLSLISFHVQSATESDKPEGVQVSEIVYKMKTKTAGDVGTVYAPTNRLN